MLSFIQAIYNWLSLAQVGHQLLKCSDINALWCLYSQHVSQLTVYVTVRLFKQTTEIFTLDLLR